MGIWAAISLVIPNLWALEAQLVPGPSTWALHMGSGCGPFLTTILGIGKKVIRTYIIFDAVFDYPIPATQEDPTTPILGYDAGLQWNESSPVAYRGSWVVDAAGPSSPVPCNPLFMQGHQASSNGRVNTHDATLGPFPTQVGGEWTASCTLMGTALSQV